MASNNPLYKNVIRSIWAVLLVVIMLTNLLLPNFAFATTNEEEIAPSEQSETSEYGETLEEGPIAPDETSPEIQDVLQETSTESTENIIKEEVNLGQNNKDEENDEPDVEIISESTNNESQNEETEGEDEVKELPIYDEVNCIEDVEERMLEIIEDEEDFVEPFNFLNVAKLQAFRKIKNTPVLKSTRPSLLSEEVSVTKNDFLETSKTVHYDEELKEYFLRLEAFLIGEDKVEKKIPSDIVLVLDQSGSMDYCFECNDDNADSVSYKAYYSDVLKGSLTAEYWCYDTANENRIRVYYCDNGDACNYVDANGNKKTHTPRWTTIDHSTATTSLGTTYIPGLADSTKLNSKIFYRAESCAEEDKYYATVNDNGEKCFGKFSVNGVYYYNTSGSRLYYCETCEAWFTKKTCNTSNHTLTYIRYPSYKSGSKNLRSVVFYEQRKAHAVYGANVLTSETYWVNPSGRAVGEPFTIVTYCTDCSAWHVPDGHDSKYYTPKEYKGASKGYTFYGTCTMSRGTALKDALSGFLASIYDNSVGKDKQHGTRDDVHNRIAVVGFAANDETTNGILSYATENATEATMKNYVELYGEDVSINPRSGTPNTDLFCHTLHDVSTEWGQTIINTAVDNLKQTSNTETFKGIRMANDVLELNPLTENEERNRVVIVFTDGEPVSSLDAGDDIYNTGTSYRFCDAALEYAHEIKNKNTTVYTIGIFSGADASDMLGSVSSAPRNNANKLMHLVSSNFLLATDADIAYGEEDVNSDLTENESYYLSASSSDGLNKIFTAIATNIIGNAAYIKTLGGPSLIQDIISPDFTLKYGDDTSKIRVHTEAYRGKFDGIRTWEDDNNEAIDEELSVIIGDNNQKVQVSGFNYTELYVATDTAYDGTISHRGRKIIIEIPIQPSDENIGGLKQMTNSRPSSCVYDENGILVEDFDMPYVDIPTKVTIQKNVTGNGSDLTKPFDFKVEYEEFGSHGNEDLAEEYDSNYLNTARTQEVSSEFQLIHNESKVLENVQVGTKMRVSELNIPDNCKIYYSVQYPDGTELEMSELVNEYIELDVVEGMVVTFTNELISTVTIVKVDTEGRMIANAVLQVLNINGDVIYEFTTSEKEHIIELVHGTYILKEVQTPNGYTVAENVEFVVTENPENIVTMVNSRLPVLVQSGGEGIRYYLLLPMMLGIVSVGICIYTTKKEKQWRKIIKTQG